MSSALLRFRVMAWVVGVMLVPTYLSLGFTLADDPQPVLKAIALVHGWLYIGYLVTVFDLYRRSRWTLGRLVLVIAAGLVPFLTFVVERRVTADVRREQAGAAAVSDA